MKWGPLDQEIPKYVLELSALFFADNADGEHTKFAAGKQFAVRKLDGTIEMYGDQGWVATGEALRTIPGTIVQRGVRIEYTDWEDFHQYDPMRVDRVAHAALLEHVRLNTRIGTQPPGVHWDEQSTAVKEVWRAVARGVLAKLDLLDREEKAKSVALRLLPCSVHPANTPHRAHPWGGGNDSSEWYWCVGDERLTEKKEGA